MDDNRVFLRHLMASRVMQMIFTLILWAFGAVLVVGGILLSLRPDGHFDTLRMLSSFAIALLPFSWGFCGISYWAAMDIIDSEGIHRIRKHLPLMRTTASVILWSQVRQCYILRKLDGEVASWKVIVETEAGTTYPIRLLESGDFREVGEVIKRNVPKERIEYVDWSTACKTRI